jgi:hypothetical protein
MLQTGSVPTEPEINGLILAASQTDKEATGAPKASDDGNALRLARELHARLGHDLISELIKSPWSELRKYLREAIKRPAADLQDLEASPTLR